MDTTKIDHTDHPAAPEAPNPEERAFQWQGAAQAVDLADATLAQVAEMADILAERAKNGACGHAQIMAEAEAMARGIACTARTARNEWALGGGLPGARRMIAAECKKYPLVPF